MPEAPEPARWESSHQIQIQGQTVQYDAVVGSVILTDDAEEPTGELFYTAYFRTDGGAPGDRPIVFSYNGGPGSASFWLHSTRQKEHDGDSPPPDWIPHRRSSTV